MPRAVEIVEIEGQPLAIPLDSGKKYLITIEDNISPFTLRRFREHLEKKFGITCVVINTSQIRVFEINQGEDNSG